MKKRILSLSTLLFIILFMVSIVSCSEGEQEQPIQKIKEETQTDETLEEPKKYVLFTINTHDWVFEEKSIATVQRVVEIHEKYNVPVAVYLTDPMTQLYAEKYPETIELLKTSSVVVVSYHIRPPVPYYIHFDFLGLEDMSTDELDDILLEYEEHAIDLETGLSTEEEGGYEYLKKVIGYPPPVVGMLTDVETGTALTKIYAEKGATFAVVHERISTLGEKKGVLFIRPEDVEIKLYEYRTVEKDPAAIIVQESENASTTRDIFINIKMHESDFYARKITWAAAYYENRDKTKPLTPPFDLSLAGGDDILKSQKEEDEMWELYENTVKYVSEHQEEFTSISEFDLVEMVG